MPMKIPVNFSKISFLCLQILALLFGQTSAFVQVANCSDGTQAVFPCDQTSKQCTGNPELGCELHGPIYFCCGTSNSSTHKPTTTTRVFPISDDNCTDKFPQCEHWAKRGICFLGMYNDMTKAKLCPKSCRVCHLAPEAAQLRQQPAEQQQPAAVGYPDPDSFNNRRLGNDDSDDMDNGGLLHGKLLPMEKSTASTMGSSPSMVSSTIPSMVSSTIPSSTSPSTTVSTEASASTIDDFGYNGKSKTGSDIASNSISTQETAAIPPMTTSSSVILIISSTSSTSSSSMPTTSSSSSTSSSSMPTTSSSSSTSSSSMPTTSSSATTKIPTIVKKRLSPEEGELIHEERELEREKTRKQGIYKKKTIDGNKKEVEGNLDVRVENGEEKKALSVKKKKKEQRKAKKEQRKAKKASKEEKNKANKIFGKNVKNMMGQEQENVPENYGNEENNRYADGKERADYDYAADYDGGEDVDDVDNYDVDGYDDGEVNEEADVSRVVYRVMKRFIDEPRGDRFFHGYLDVYKRKQDDFWTQWKAGMRGLQHRLEEEESNRRLPKKSRLKNIVIKERTKIITNGYDY